MSDALYVFTSGAAEAFQRNQPVTTIPIELTVPTWALEAYGESLDLCDAAGKIIAQALHEHADKFQTAHEPPTK